MYPIISVIVPVFRVEKYLIQCINSILNQTFKDYEILLIDDGSDDNCPLICDSIASKYNNVQVVHQTNKGLPSARNTGIKNAKGKYIMFCDSDDMMKPEMLQLLYGTAEKNSVDVVMCGYETFPNGRVVSPKVKAYKVLSSQEFIESSKRLSSDNDLSFSWRFLIKKDLLNEKEIFFNESLVFGEDFPFNLSVIMEAESIYVIQDALYLYRIDNYNSIMRTKYKERLAEKITIQYNEKVRLSKKYNLWNNTAWRNDLCDYYMNTFAWMLFRNAMFGPNSDKYSEIKKIVRLPCLAENYNYGYKQKLLFLHGRKNGLFLIACFTRLDKVVYSYVKKHYK